MADRRPSFSWLLRHPDALLAFGFGSGLAPRMPGTCGTLLAIPLYIPLSQLALAPYLLSLVIAFAFGVWICQTTSRKLGVHDHGGIVWDEFVGFWLTMVAAPKGVAWIIAGFLLFRIFDVIKPWPIAWVDKHVHGGFGIMIDDVIAAIPAALCLQFLIYAVSFFA